MKQDELKYRYVIKLISSAVIVLLNGIVQFILPRVLAVEDYGYYSYNLNVFTSVVNMANLSVSGAMVSKFSKRNEDRGLIFFYLGFYGVITVILTISVAVLYSLDILRNSFQGQTILTVLLALESSLLSRFFVDNIGIFDSMAIVRFPAVSQVFMRFLLAAVVIGGYFLGKITLVYFYISQIIIIFSVATIMILAALKEQKRRFPHNTYRKSFKEYALEYFIYCKPLIGSSIFSQGAIIFMNWALMRWSGAVQQAQFGAAWQLNTLVTYVFSPYADLMRREFAVVFDKTEQLSHRFLQSMSLMSFITSYIVVFICVEVESIVTIIYGDRYIGATIITIIVMVYTLFQAWGQIEGAFLYAIEDTKTNAKVTVLSQTLMIFFVFLFQIPNPIWVNSLGGVGIALNYMLVNIISVEITLILIVRKMSISFIKYNSIQAITFAFFLLAGVFSKYPIESIWKCDAGVQLVVRTVCIGMLYTCFSALLFCLFPSLIGINRKELRMYIKKLIKR